MDLGCLLLGSSYLLGLLLAAGQSVEPSSDEGSARCTTIDGLRKALPPSTKFSVAMALWTTRPNGLWGRGSVWSN
eukprot:1372493-Amphidinium_carterae.1